MQLNIRLPDDWREELKQKVEETGAQSGTEWVEWLVADTLSKARVKRKPWGGRRPYSETRQGDTLGKSQDDSLGKSMDVGIDQGAPEGDKTAHTIVKIEPPVSPPDKPRKSGMAQPKNPNLQWPPNYNRKPVLPKPKIPPVVGGKTGKDDETEEGR